jgi:hypothetical protein
VVAKRGANNAMSEEEFEEEEDPNKIKYLFKAIAASPS